MSPARITVSLTRNQRWTANGPMELARSVRKWGIKPTHHTPFYVHENVLRRKKHPHHHHKKSGQTEVDPSTGTSGGDAEVPANDVQGDLEYVVPVTIGTPGVQLTLDFDTGSSDLWCWSSLTKGVSTSGHTIYNPQQSSTAKQQSGSTWQISYGDGSSASGEVFSDTVTIGDVAIPNQAVEAAQKLSSAFSQGEGSDGLLGLAFPAINTVRPTAAKTPVENMIEQNLIAQPLFTAKLDRGDSNGFYTFGYIADASDSDAQGDVAYTDVDSSNGFWEFSSPSMSIDGKTIDRGSSNTAIADTGTTLLLVSDDAVEQLYNGIQGAKLDNTQGGYVFPTNATVPDTISFAVGSNMFSIPGSDLAFADAGSGMSFGAVQSRGQNPQDILGDVFLKRVYAVFNQSDSPQLGLAQRPLTS